MISPDTHVLIDAFHGTVRARERALLSRDSRSVASIVLWEPAKLAQLGRIDMDLEDPDVLAALASVHIWPLDLDMARASTRLDFRGDPADEITDATSLVHRVPLLTRDRRLHRCKIVPLAG